MQELHNTEDFKETLRACLLAGFMRGCQDRWELTDDFKAACKEEINCPRLLSLFDYEPAVLQNIFKSITFDNGTEFAAAEELERSCINKHLPRTKVYFCHPYSSWERGTNENTNGMIRRRFPKGTNFAAVTNAQIAQAENWINNYPRKILGYKSSEIVFRECLRELGIAA